MIVIASTSSWVRVTSGAPRARICTVARIPTAESATTVVSRECDVHTTSTATVMSTRRMTSTGRLSPSCRPGSSA